jgi:hypothetical protein
MNKYKLRDEWKPEYESKDKDQKSFDEHVKENNKVWKEIDKESNSK